jgi:sugar/nucleoside kinase (ribokinase family)
VPTAPRGYSPDQMILSIGDLLLDITIVPDGAMRPDDDRPASIRFGGGGQAANFCAWTASLGEPVRLITRLGNDDRGRQLVADMEALAVEVCPVWGPEPTGVIAVLVGPGGQRAMATDRGASVALQPNDLRRAWFTDVRLIHVPAYSLFVEPLASAAKAAIELVRRGGGMLAVDLSSVAGLQDYGPARMAYDLARLKPEVLFATAAEAETLGVPLDGVAQVPVVKLGSDGCIVFGHKIQAPPVPQIDPTGAGDAFAASFCTSWLQGATPVEAAKRAVVVAADAVTRTGARPAASSTMK